MRHEAKHAKNAVSGETDRVRMDERASKACGPCVLSKVKCDNGRPCKRCETKNLTCGTINSMSVASPSSTMDSGQTPVDKSRLPSQHQRLQGSTSNTANVMAAPFRSGAGDEEDLNAQVLLNLYGGGGILGHVFDAPPFFNHIMVSETDWIRGEVMSPPPDLTSWMPDLDWLEQADLFADEFTRKLDQAFGHHLSSPQSTAVIGAVSPDTAREITERDSEDSSREWDPAFKRSPL